MNTGRLAAIAVWLPVPAAGLLWASSRMSWATVHSADGLTEPQVEALTGSTYSAVPSAFAIVLLASVAALLAVRGWATSVVAAVVATAALAVGIQAAAVLVTGIEPGRAAAALGLPGRAEIVSVDRAPAGPAVAVVGTTLALFAAVVVMVTRRRRRGLSDRFERPGQRTTDAGNSTNRADNSPNEATESLSESGKSGGETGTSNSDSLEHRSARVETNTGREDSSPSDRELWDALDAGEDPTA